MAKAKPRAPLEIHPAKATGCATCGAEPSGTYRDGTPTYACSHPPFVTKEHAAELRAAKVWPK